MGITVNPDNALQRFLRLTAIPGPSCQEQEVAQAIIDALVEAGLPPEAARFDEAHRATRQPGQCGNLIVEIPGTAPGPTTLLTAHMDTVPICVGSQPIVDGDDVISQNPESGLGADNRSGCAVLLTAACELLTQGIPHPTLKLAWFVQEEIGLEGSRNLQPERIGDYDRAINFDGGTVEKLTIGAIGGERMTIDVRGIAAHAGVCPETGASAIVMASKAIAQLAAEGWLGKVDRGPGRTGTANVGVFNGGDATNVVTPAVHVRAEARSHRADLRSEIVAAIEKAFGDAAAEVKNEAGQAGSIEFTSHVDYEAFQLEESSPGVIAAKQAVEAVGRTPILNVSNGGLDANWLFCHGIEAVTIGCGQRNFHTATERLHVPDYLDACRIAVALAEGRYVAGETTTAGGPPHG